MKQYRRFAGALALAAACAWSAGALGAAADPEPLVPTGPSKVTLVPDAYQLETEMIVQNWFICISQPLAEQLVRAREASYEAAEKAYAELIAAKSCGQLGEMRVILQKAVYESAPESAFHGRIFNALIQFSGKWANGFVISGDVE